VRNQARCDLKRLQDLRTDSMLTAAGMEAVKTLICLQDGAIAAPVRLGAARTVLEFDIKLRENNEIVERIAALDPSKRFDRLTVVHSCQFS
jgi:hypothetical protein